MGEEIRPFFVLKDKVGVLISPHAVEQFVARTKRYFPRRKIRNPEDELLEAFESAVEENVDPVTRVRRMLNNGLETAKYFYHLRDGWRFTIIEKFLLDEIPVLVIKTVEKDWFGFERKINLYKPPRRSKKTEKRNRKKEMT